MEAYRFDTRISEKGIISLPFEPALYGKNVEIIILPKVKHKKETANSAKSFLKRWSGVLKTNRDLENDKQDYLKNKHQ